MTHFSNSYSDSYKVGDRVIILYPSYVAGRTGVVRAKEQSGNGRESDRWLIQVDATDILVSLYPGEFQLLR